MRQQKGLKAWLVTWEWCGDHAKPAERVAEILSPRLHPERVREIVELRYNRESSLSEKVAWRLRKKKQPYPAEFASVEGVRWHGQIICGHNPSLLARLVDNLVINVTAEGSQNATWTDRHSAGQVAEKIRGMRRESQP